MNERPSPGPHESHESSEDHRLTVEPTGVPVTVRVDGEVVAETTSALTLREASYPGVQYIPIGDVAAELIPSDTATYCPYKGAAGYYHLRTRRGVTVQDAVWTYEQPLPAVSSISGHVAFYPNKADVRVNS